MKRLILALVAVCATGQGPMPVPSRAFRHNIKTLADDIARDVDAGTDAMTLQKSTKDMGKDVEADTEAEHKANTKEGCSNVKDWNFFNSRVTQNNLGGVGPNKDDKQEIRYADVADGVDLVLTTDMPNYVTNPKVKEVDGKKVSGCDNNGIHGQFGSINVNGGTAVTMQFTLVEAGTDTPVSVAPEQTVFFSVYDMDSNAYIPGSREYVDFTTPVDSYSVTATSTVQITGDKTHLSATAGRTGNETDNPTDPLSMTQEQKDSAVWITYKGKNNWGMTFGEKGKAGTKWKGGRNLMFAGRAEGDCPPGPVAPPPGACTAGIEGMIKGGGRVCCPDSCGGPRFSEAPNACGGPGCDKGPDGKRNMDRYKNCCVGKPVEGATATATINAPYGIVSQGRFCTGLGSDGPPCINRLSRESNPGSTEML